MAKDAGRLACRMKRLEDLAQVLVLGEVLHGSVTARDEQTDVVADSGFLFQPAWREDHAANHLAQ